MLRAAVTASTIMDCPRFKVADVPRGVHWALTRTATVFGRGISRIAMVAVVLASIGVVTSQKQSGPYRPDAVGAYRLPNLTSTVLPPMCDDFAAACAAEAAGKYHHAMHFYEEKYSVCGDHGWNLTGHSQGFTDFVVFKTTPCGLPVVIKQAMVPAEIVECQILRRLTSKTLYLRCPGCFPKFYHLSQFTQACYSEAVPVVPGKFAFLQTSKINRDRDIAVAKRLYLQAVTIVQVLREVNIEHRDLKPQNILLRNMTREDGSVSLQVVLVDFGAARRLSGHHIQLNETTHDIIWTNYTPDDTGTFLAHSTDNYLNDLFEITCWFYTRVRISKLCQSHSITQYPDDAVNDTSSLAYALVTIMNKYASRVINPDFDLISGIVQNVTHF
jgi:hypothetical protein